MTSDLKVVTINTESGHDFNGTDNIDAAELFDFMKKNPDDVVIYDLGIYFSHQNDEELGSHWSYLVNMRTKELYNNCYNSQIGAV